jgi:hypothetical protein
VVRAETAGQLRGNTPVQQEESCVFCAAWSVPRLHKRQFEGIVQLSVEDSHGKLVVEEELEVSL